MLHRDYSWLRNTKKMLSTAVHLLRSVLKITVSNIYIYIVRNILSLYEHARNLFLALIFGLNQFRCTETFNKHVLSSIKLSLEEKNPLGSTRWIYFRLKHRSCRSLQFFLFESRVILRNRRGCDSSSLTTRLFVSIGSNSSKLTHEIGT